MYFMSRLDEKGKPKDKDGPIKCSSCGFISKDERGHKHHISVHRRGKVHSYHDERLFKSGKYTYE